jgi:hypothetical protein
MCLLFGADNDLDLEANLVYIDELLKYHLD